MRRFVERHRKDEHDYVVTGMENLRHAVRVFIHCTTGSFRAERSSEEVISSELDHLGRALAINDHAQIRQAAERTAATVRQELEARHVREKKQIEALQDSMDKLRHELSEVKREARIDGLTRIFNRAAFDEHVAQVADHTFLSGTESCLVMIDVDYFKGINDNYGHQTGDEVLRQIADTIVRGFIRREDFVARYGGEEFCVICQHTTFETTRERAERVRQAVERLEVSAFGRSLKVSVSFGLALLQRGETAQSWIQRADEALYRAKQKGRNRISTAPLGLGEALGGKGAPLGATLHVQGPEVSPRIIVSESPSPRSGNPPSSRISREPRDQSTPNGRPRVGARSRAGVREDSGGIAANENGRGRTPTDDPPRPNKNKEGRVKTSPIAALLGPSSSRR